MNPAYNVLKKFGYGSASFVAAELDLDRSTVSRWTKSKAKGGTNGIIPARYHKELLRLAEKNDIDLTAEELIGVEMESA